MKSKRMTYTRTYFPFIRTKVPTDDCREQCCPLADIFTHLENLRIRPPVQNQTEKAHYLREIFFFIYRNFRIRLTTSLGYLTGLPMLCECAEYGGYIRGSRNGPGVTETKELARMDRTLQRSW